MGKNTCASLKIDLYRLEFCVRLKLRFGNLNIFNYKRDKFLTDEYVYNVCTFKKIIIVKSPEKLPVFKIKNYQFYSKLF